MDLECVCESRTTMAARGQPKRSSMNGFSKVSDCSLDR